MDNYTKLITVIDNNYQYYHIEKILEILEDVKNKKKKIIFEYMWFSSMNLAEMEQLAMDLLNIQLLSYFEDITQHIYSQL